MQVAGWLPAATVGTVVPIIGEPGGMAYDAVRRLLFISNTSQNRVEVYSVPLGQLMSPIPVGRAPLGLAVVPDANLLVVCNAADSFISLIDLATLTPAGTVPIPPLRPGSTVPETGFSVAAMQLGLALVSTTFGVHGFNAHNKTFYPVASTPFTAPGNAELAVSQDGRLVLGASPNTAFLYGAVQGTFQQVRRVAGSRVLAADSLGSRFLIGDSFFDSRLLQTGQINPLTAPGGTVGGVTFSPDGSRIYAGYTQRPAAISVLASDDRRVLSTFRVPEPIIGRMIVSPDHARLYAISNSGLTVVDLNSVAAAPSLQVSKRQIFFNFFACNLGPSTQTIQITNSGGGTLSWTASSSTSVITLNATGGGVPGELEITVNPSAFPFRGSALIGTVRITSEDSISGDTVIPVIVNMANPDQVGAIFPVEGYVSDILVDDERRRVYLVNTTKNQIEVFLIAQRTFQTAVPVGSLPKAVTFSRDRKLLLVTNLGAEYISTIDADTLVPGAPILMPIPPPPQPNETTPAPGTHPFAIATPASGAILFTGIASAGSGAGTVYRLDPGSSTPVAFPTLGTAPNVISGISNLAATGNGAFVYLTQGSSLHLYDSSTGNFAINRSSPNAVLANVAGSADGSFYHSNAEVLNSVLASRDVIPSGTAGTVAGFVFSPSGPTGYRSIRPSVTGNQLPPPSRIEKVDAAALKLVSSFNLAEALAPGATSPLLSIARQLAVDRAETTLYGVSESGLIVISLPGSTGSPGPRISPGGVVNGASFALAPAPAAPGSIATVFGTDLAGGISFPSGLPLPTVLGETCVTFEGVAAPLFYSSPTQLNVQVPWEISGRTTAQVAVGVGSLASQPVTVNIAPAAPGIFAVTGDGQGAGAILHSSDFSLVSPANPATIGEVVSIYATGLGPVQPALETEQAAPTDGTLIRSNVPAVTIGAVNAPVLFAGLAPGFVGLYQIDVRVPSNSPVGTNVPVVITAGSRSNVTTMAVVPSR